MFLKCRQGVYSGVGIGLVQADDPAKYSREFIEGTYRFARAIVQHHGRDRYSASSYLSTLMSWHKPDAP